MARRTSGITVGAAGIDGKPYTSATGGSYDIGCIVRQLPSRLLERAAEVAACVNPVNAPAVGGRAEIPGVISPLMIAVVTSKYWGPTPRTLSVSFMDNPPSDLRRRILSHMNAWATAGSVEFAETASTGDVRIARGGSGFWSYLGTDILLIPRHLPTMNLQDFTMQTPESEYRRVVRHEAGHTLGMPHEHMRKALVERIDREKVYAYFRNNFGWDEMTVNQQVLTPLDEATLIGTPVDQDSIMCYQLPGSITKDGQPIRGGLDINPNDFAFLGRIYPKPAPAPVDGRLLSEGYTDAYDWPEADDVADLSLHV